MNKPMLAEPAKLYVSSSRTIGLKEALDKAAKLECFEGAIGLFYSPKKCSFARLEQIDNRASVIGLQHTKDRWKEYALDLKHIFEARLFSSTSEMTWLHCSSDKGDITVWVSDNSDLSSIGTSVDLKEAVVGKLRQKYLIWGRLDRNEHKVAEVPEGWSVVSSSQIGCLAVPISMREGKEFLRLNSSEYVSTEGDCGNAFIQYERLESLQWVSKAD